LEFAAGDGEIDEHGGHEFETARLKNRAGLGRSGSFGFRLRIELRPYMS
jgi:hypothetical protein